MITAIWATAVWSVARLTVDPWRCSCAEASALRRTASLIDQQQTVRLPIARSNIDMLLGCHDRYPHRIGAEMILAANYRFAGRPAMAVQIYSDALRWHKRPELYLNLGEALIEAGHEKEGVKTLRRAAVYNPTFVAEVPAYSLPMQDAVIKYEARLAARRNR